jgi:hypothetical protein
LKLLLRLRLLQLRLLLQRLRLQQLKKRPRKPQRNNSDCSRTGQSAGNK